jgi:hypothetical protein
MNRIAALITALLVAPLGWAASPPTLVNYQGVLRDAADKPRTGTFDMTFRFFDALSAGNELLVDAHTGGGGNAVSVTGGLFNVQLGGGTVFDGSGPGVYAALDDVFRDHGSVWVEIAIGAETLSPRVRVQSAAYALNASNLQGRGASSFVDTSGTSQTKQGRLAIADPSASAGYGLEVSTPAVAAVYGSNSGGGADGYLGYGTIGVWGQGPFTGGYFRDEDASGSAYVGYTDWGIQANGNLGGGYFYDNSGASATVGGGGVGVAGIGGTYGVTGYSSAGAGGYFDSGFSAGEAYLASGNYGIYSVGVPAGYFISSSGSGTAALGSGDTGIDATGRWPGGSAGHFRDNIYTGEAWLATGNTGIVAKGTYQAGEFQNPTTGAYALMAPDNGTASKTAGYFWNPSAPWGEFNLGVWAYVATQPYGAGSSGLFTNGGKNFVQNHPHDPTRAVVYTALEAGEAGTYTRGSAEIDGGRATVALDPTFAMTTNPDIGLTAVVTPHGTWADLYVVSVSTGELVVASRDPAASGVRFDYIVNGLRLGFENGAVVVPSENLPNATVAPIEVSQTLLAELPEDVRASTPLARYLRMRPASLREEAVDLTRTRALIAGIDSSEHARLARPASPASQRIDAQGEIPKPQQQPRPEVLAERPVATFLVPVTETVETGDVLANDPQRPGELRRTFVAADPGLVGVVAGLPGAIWSGSAPIALAGTVVLAKADASAGPIQANDLLVSSSLAGHVMRAGESPKQGTVVGKALEPLESGTGTIRILVMPH